MLWEKTVRDSITAFAKAAVIPFYRRKLQRFEALLGRAMGRVLGHELYHVFAKTMDHGHSGVAKTSHSRNDLVGERFEFDGADSKRIRRQ